MVVTALYWLLVLELFSIAALPLVYRAFSQLPDRGWAFSKPLGLLGVGFGVWAIGLTHSLSNSRLSVAFALLLLAIVSLAAARRVLPEMRDFVRANRNPIIAAELLFIAVFAGMALMRASISTIGHTEQPMDFMLLNSVVASPHYPPNDAWLAGEPVSYYYFGYLMIGAATLLSGIATSIAYNLGLATVAAVAGVAAFGVAYNLVRLARGTTRGAVLGGCAAVFLLLIASNLGGALELVRAAGAGSAGFWEFIGLKGLTAPTAPSTGWAPTEFNWWFKASRIAESTGAGPTTITEFPFFSFLLGDMHPHVMSIGFVLLAVGIAIQMYLQPALLRAPTLRREWPLLLTTVVGIGALGAINLWDLPLGFALLGSAVMLNAARNERSLQSGASLALSADTLIVGAPTDSQTGHRAGSATIYTQRESRWKRMQTLVPVAPRPDCGFGTSSAGADDLIVVGAPRATEQGAVFVFGQQGGKWFQRTTLRPPDDTVDDFGLSVAAIPGMILVGARNAAFIYTGFDLLWELHATLPMPGGVADFGSTVALEPETAIVGAPRGAGAVVVFTRDEESWTLDAVLRGNERDAIVALGRSLAFDGRQIAAGARGAAVVFDRWAGGWRTAATLTPPHPSLADSFGVSVAIDRRYAAVGADGQWRGRPTAGAVFVYESNYDGDDVSWDFHYEVTPREPDADAAFGAAVALAGDTLAAGSPGSGHGATFIFDRTLDRWRPQRKLGARWRFVRAVALAGALAAASMAAFAPFFMTFDASASAILPLRQLLTRPVHLLLIWGIPTALALPVLWRAIGPIFARGNWSTMRFGIGLFVGFTPIAFWLQPFYAMPLYALALALFSLHQAGYRMPLPDEMSFAYNPRITLAVGSSIVIGGFIYDGVVNNERGIDGELIALDRLSIVVPIALIISLTIYGAWTLAHRDSEALRTARPGAGNRTASDATTPLLLLLGTACALIMGVELFHVADIFGGDLRRLNTVFKLYYQAWILMAVLGGFGLWYVASRLDRTALIGRVGFAAWTAVLVVALGAVVYYPLAGTANRAGDAGFELDGLAQLERWAPAELMAIQWVRDNVPRDAVIVESPVVACPSEPRGCSSYTEAARISQSTGRPTVLGWYGHERQWRSSDKHSAIDARLADVRELYETQDVERAGAILRKYDADYIVVGDRERGAYGADGLAKFTELGEVVFGDESGVLIYELPAGDRL